MLVDLKGTLVTLASIEKDLVAFRKDLESLQKWKDEMKTERDEAARRLWAFGPNLLAAIISGLISLGVALLVVWLRVCSITPPPGPLPEAERGRKTAISRLSPPLRFGEGAGGWGYGTDSQQE